MPAAKTKEQRIFDNSIPEPNSGCWLWVGSIDKCGYGKTSGAYSLAHRLSYAAFIGEIPKGLEVDHLCKQRCCVNPDHLEAVTHAVNVSRGDYTSNHRNGRKTHCQKGHPLSGDNLYVERRNGVPVNRRCKACRSAVRHKKYMKRKGVKIKEIAA